MEKTWFKRDISMTCVADVHVANHRRFGGKVMAGINTRGRMVLRTLKYALEAAPPGPFVVCGDLFDTSHPEPQLIAAVASLFRQRCARFSEWADWSEKEAQVVLLVGNHDQTSDAPGDHALGALGELPGVMVVERPTVLKTWGFRLYALPYRVGEADHYLRSDMHALTKDADAFRETDMGVIVAHAGLRMPSTPHYLLEAPDSIGGDTARELIEMARSTGSLRNNPKVILGNWHSPESMNHDVHQCGSLAPVKFSETHRGSMLRVGITGVARSAVPGPRFLSITAEPFERAVDTLIEHHASLKWEQTGEFLHVSIELTPSEGHPTSAMHARMRHYMQELGFAGYELVPSRKSREAVSPGSASLTAAQQFKATGRAFEEAVTRWVTARTDPALSEDVKRGALAHLVAAYGEGET